VQKLLLPMIGILATALACGCNSAKSPAAVATDVAAARQQATTEVTDTQRDAAKNVDSVAANVVNHPIALMLGSRRVRDP
jgi:hypothetical protein